MRIDFVPAVESDETYLLALRKQTMTEHLEAAGLFLSEAEHLARLRHLYSCCYLVLINGERIGAIKYQSTASELNLLQLQIERDHQGAGYGSAIIQQILAHHAGKQIGLSVLKANPAFGLYQRLGFAVVGEDEHEYLMRYEV
ncbi:GNAT family N-acetyltransferase [Arenicella xantha]|uniref:Acetyltransferase (GNAT) family protein n=1 Tax=Arenicella xantha TaxID=644221 RepID=A0A395JQL3_9GAMM|nr:GNAT family N-acetyltransferase [Arenicella xantha]RBP53653.1 acetyltransferase (GNAT) family protein [Arenicella xantha]